MNSCKPIDAFNERKPETIQTPAVLGRISHIDDKLIPATSWTDFTKKWNDCYMHSTSRICRIAYPEVITNGARWIILFIKYTRCIESYPKDLGSLVNILFLERCGRCSRFYIVLISIVDSLKTLRICISAIRNTQSRFPTKSAAWKRWRRLHGTKSSLTVESVKGIPIQVVSLWQGAIQ